MLGFGHTNHPHKNIKLKQKSKHQKTPPEASDNQAPDATDPGEHQQYQRVSSDESSDPYQYPSQFEDFFGPTQFSVFTFEASVSATIAVLRPGALPVSSEIWLHHVCKKVMCPIPSLCEMSIDGSCRRGRVVILEPGFHESDGRCLNSVGYFVGRGFSIPSVGFGWKVWTKPRTYQSVFGQTPVSPVPLELFKWDNCWFMYLLECSFIEVDGH